MSQENLEIVRRAFERWQEGGGTADAVPPEIFAEDVEWNLSAYPIVDLPTRGKGRDDLMDTWTQYFSGWRDYRPEAREFIDAGDDVIVLLHETASVAGSEITIERDVPHVWTLRDGLVVRWRVFEGLDDARRAVALSE